MSVHHIHISSISSYIGQNPYNGCEAFTKLLKKLCPQETEHLANTYKTEIINTATTTIQLKTKVEEIKQSNLTARQKTIKTKELEQLISSNEHNVKELERNLDVIVLSEKKRLEKVIGKDIDTLTKEEILNHTNITDKEILKQAKQYTNQRQGIQTEETSLTMTEQQLGITLDKTQKYASRKLDVQGKHTWYLGGRVDGKTDDTIIEIKDRMSHYFKEVRIYEKTQIQLYMWLHDVNNAKLVERHNKHIKVTDIPRDQPYIDHILLCISTFLQLLEEKLPEHTSDPRSEGIVYYLKASPEEQYDIFYNTFIKHMPIYDYYSNVKCVID